MDFGELLNELALSLNALHRRNVCGRGETLAQCFILSSVPDDGILVQNQVTAVSIGTELWGWMQGGNPGQESFFPEQQATVVRGL